MAQTPTGPIPGARPVETTPIRVGQGRPGVPTLQPDRLYPALVVRGGERPVLRLLGHNVQGEPRRPGLQEGARLLIRPEIQGSRVLLHVMEHGDVLNRVSQRFGRMLYRNPWPLPQAQAGGGGFQAGGPGGGAALAAGRPPGAPPGSAPLAPGPGVAAQPGRGSGPVAQFQLPGTQALLQDAGGVQARLALVGRPDQWALPRPPLQGGGQLQAALARPAVPAPGLAGGAAAAQASGSAAQGAEASTASRAAPASGDQPVPPRTLSQPRPGQALVAALLNPQAEGSARIAGSREAVRHWLDALLKPGRESAGGERSERGGPLFDRLLTEKGRLLLDRWAYIPLPLSGERSGAWLQIQDRSHDEGAEGDGEQPQTLRVWLSSERLGGMELILPLGQGRTWRVRCESAATRDGLEAERSRLERLCRNAGQTVTLRIEGPDPGVADPPESLRRAQGLEHSVSSRA